MPDYFKGKVERVLDEKTIIIGVEFVGESNRAEYNHIETIHISKLEPPFLKNIDQGNRVERLEKKLIGKTVYCYILGKDESGAYSSKVVCDGPEFRGKRSRV